jgi:aminomethyltransferase
MVDFAGWDMPIQYSTIIDEHQAVRTAAGIFDISHMARLTFEGPDALGLIQRIYTNDAAGIKPGQARYGLVCNDQGGILDDVLVYRFAPYWMMVVNASNREKIVGWIEQHRAGFQAQVTDRTRDWAMVALQGPRAVAIADAIWGTPGKLKYYHAELASGRPADQPLILSRTGYTGEDGVEVIVPAAEILAVVDKVFATAKQLGINLKPCGLGARDTLRLEAAMPLYGHELGEETDPFQAGLAWAVKMEKGDFIGREALAKRRQEGNLPQRVGLELEGKRIAREGAAVLRQGRAVGRITSGTFAPTLGKAVAMAYVESSVTVPGTEVEVDVRGKPAAARVVPLPFYRRAKP